MTNWERWQLYTKHLMSPQNYIDWGYIFTISAALQRRVWCPPDWRKCYPNIYVTLVGKPGIGKGQVIKCINEVLDHPKLHDYRYAKARCPEDQKVLDAMHQINEKEESQLKEEGYKRDKLFPSGANSATYEELVHRMAKNVSRINYYIKNGDGTEHMKIESHCSIYFCLEEMASLFRKHQENLVNFLLEAYDSNEVYEYAIRSRAPDRINRICLAMFAGTTPDFMQQTFDDKITNQGLSSRQFYVYAAKNRGVQFFMPELDDDQKLALKEYKEYIQKLSGIYGQLDVSKEIQEYCQSWAEERFKNPDLRESKSPKLDAFYERMNIHIMKVATCWHYGRTLDNVLTLEDVQWAMRFIGNESKTMHHALVLTGNNPLAKVANRIVEHLNRRGSQTYEDLLCDFFEDVTKDELSDCIQMLEDTKKIFRKQETVNGIIEERFKARTEI